MSTLTPSRIMITVLAGLLIAYSSLFSAYEKRIAISPPTISPTLPVVTLKVIGHIYLKQLIAESLFIKTAVFYGGLKKRMNEDNLHIMGQHFLAMGQLHPKLLDIYYRSESSLAHKGAVHTKTVNQILEHGRGVLPEQIELPFFEGFNYFHYLNEPVKAAKILRIASNITDSPQWIGHLASMLMASSGNIRTGLIWLKGMLSTTQNEDEKARFEKDIIAFEKALQVQMALDRYVARIGSYPDHLNDLLLADLQSIPTWEDGFVLEYQSPQLFLRRQAPQ